MSCTIIDCNRLWCKLILCLLFFGSTFAATKTTISKNLSFDHKKETKFDVVIDTSKINQSNDNIEELQDLLLKKISKKVFDFKLNKYKVSFDTKMFSFSWKYWFFFENNYTFERKDIVEEEDTEHAHSIILESVSLQSKTKPTKTSLIVITFDIVNNDANNESGKHQLMKVNVVGTSHGISKKHFEIIIDTLKRMLETEMQREVQLIIARSKDARHLNQESKKQVLLDRKREIDKILHPDKYAKPKGRSGKNGEVSGRYTPSKEAQARRQKGGG